MKKKQNFLRAFWLETSCFLIALIVMYRAMSANDADLTVRIVGFILGLPILALTLIVISRALRALINRNTHD
jgi:hypothetical protein